GVFLRFLVGCYCPSMNPAIHIKGQNQSQDKLQCRAKQAFPRERVLSGGLKKNRFCMSLEGLSHSRDDAVPNKRVNETPCGLREHDRQRNLPDSFSQKRRAELFD